MSLSVPLLSILDKIKGKETASKEPFSLIGCVGAGGGGVQIEPRPVLSIFECSHEPPREACLKREF